MLRVQSIQAQSDCQAGIEVVAEDSQKIRAVVSRPGESFTHKSTHMCVD
jgi:hypothetical protein